MQEIIYRALERDPKNRYGAACEVAWDLEHQDQVGVSGDRPELHDWKKRKSNLPKKILTYALLALIPIAVFSLCCCGLRGRPDIDYSTPKRTPAL